MRKLNREKVCAILCYVSMIAYTGLAIMEFKSQGNKIAGSI